MRITGLVAALGLVWMTLAAPPLAAAPFGVVWNSTPSSGYRVYSIADLNGDGALDLLTGEFSGPPGEEHIGVRSILTGDLQAQSGSPYEASGVFHIDLDGDGQEEILFTNVPTGRFTCLSFSPPGLTPRWAIRPSFAAGEPFSLAFADLDGNGQMYVVFNGPSPPDCEFEIFTNQGVLFAAYTPYLAFNWSLEYMGIQDYDADGRDEILLIYRYSGSDEQHLILLESTVPVGVEPRPDGHGLRAVELGSSTPNPAAEKTRIDYTVPARGPVTLRLLDVGGREVRVLVDGEVAAGRHEVVWDGRDARGRPMPAGAYFYELEAGGQRLGRRVIRLP